MVTSKTISLDGIEKFEGACVLAVGMFDGLHIGHARVFKKAGELAKKHGAILGVLTFSPHPSTVVDMGRPPVKMICGAQTRAQMFAEAGARAVFIKNFDKRFASRSSGSFEKFLKEKFPNLKGLVTGENFLFGAGARGNAETLAEISARSGWEYVAVRGVRLKNGARMSSSLMREALSSGNLKLYKRIAGRDYECAGAAVSGKKLGRKIGFPTINLPWNPDCKPPFGAYAAELIRGGRVYAGVANYGVNPTVGEEPPVLETHLFENVRFGAPSKISVRMLKFLRAEKKFPSLDALKRQIARDKTAAQKYFARRLRK